MELVNSIQTEGELNYVITRLCDSMGLRWGGNYAALNAILGVLDAVPREFYRRRVAPYEDKKIKENSDVYSV